MEAIEAIIQTESDMIITRLLLIERLATIANKERIETIVNVSS